MASGSRTTTPCETCGAFALVPMKLRLTDNLARVEADLDAFAASIRDVALPRALNTLRDQAEVAGLREIKDVYQIPSITMRAFLTDKQATAGDPEASITAKGRGFPMSVFKPVQTAKGVQVTVKGRSFVIPHSFMVAKFGQHVFARGSYGGKYGGTPTGERFGRFVYVKGESKGRRHGLPIAELYSFAPPDCLANAGVTAAMDDRVAAQAAAVLAREISAARRGF